MTGPSTFKAHCAEAVWNAAKRNRVLTQERGGAACPRKGALRALVPSDETFWIEGLAWPKLAGDCSVRTVKPSGEAGMGKFIIEPHFRLQEWVAEEKGYFRDEGLDYEFRELVRSTDGQHHATPNRTGAYNVIEQGRKSHVSCACHWTVNVAAAAGHARLYAGVYSVSPSGIFVPEESPVKTPGDLAHVPISVGYKSGSHYSTLQALEQYLRPEEINLSFSEGLLFRRMELLIDRKVPAAALFSGPYYFAEQLGFRKVIDSTFMIAHMVHGDPDPEDVRKFYRALRRAQRDIDLRPERYTHYYKREFPARFHAMMDTRRWGPGERIVFEPYGRKEFEDARSWIADHGIFEDGNLGARSYEQAIYPAALG